MDESRVDEQRGKGTKARKNTHIQLVQELDGPNDRWITVVDAARMTGASESMANRWVTSGRLQIRGNLRL